LKNLENIILLKIIKDFSDIVLQMNHHLYLKNNFDQQNDLKLEIKEN